MTNKDVLILMTSTLSVGKIHRPFTNFEIVKVIDKLKENNLELKNLYGLQSEEVFKLFFGDEEKNEKNTQFVERIQLLLTREGSMAFDLMEIKKWGIQILTIYDEKYPEVFIKKLGKRAPVLLYYCGNLDLLNHDFIGFSGSRLKNLSESDEKITRLWSRAVNRSYFGVVSGGASGVDTFAVQEAILANGEFIEFLSDSMIKRIKISQISKALQAGKGLILSETNPYASFNAGMAMARNKYIYLIAKKVIVIRADYTIKANKKTGGTWNGAIENLKSNYRKTYVIKNERVKGNKELIEMGAIPLTDPEDEISYNLIFKEVHNYELVSKNQTINELDKKMVEVLKRPTTLIEIKLTAKQREKTFAIKEAIAKVQNSFSEFLIEKNIYNKFYKYCHDVATGKIIKQQSLFD